MIHQMPGPFKKAGISNFIGDSAVLEITKGYGPELRARGVRKEH
jgi:hypothetical protein